MAFTYHANELGTSALFRARFQLGDTNRDAPLLQDEEITGLIDAYGPMEGVAQLADGLASKYAQEPDEYTDEGGVKVKWSFKVKVWQDLAARIRRGLAQAEAGTTVSRPAIGRLTQPCMKGVRP